MSESLHRVAQTSQGASALSPALAEVAPQVQRLGFIGRLVRNPEWFTVGLILVTCLVVGTLNPRFFQFATLFDLLHSGTTVSLFALWTLVVLASGGIDVSLPRLLLLRCIRSPRPFL